LGFDTTKKAKAEFEETAKLEILFLKLSKACGDVSSTNFSEIFLLDSSQKAKAEFEETAKLEILFLTDVLKSINGNRSQLFKKWTSDFHDVTEVLEVLLATGHFESWSDDLGSNGSESTCESSETTPLKVFL
jgi:spore coat protein CotH